MSTSDISYLDYTKIFGFLQEIVNVPQNQFRFQMLTNLNKLFGYEYSSFWLINNNMELYDPVCFNIKKSLVTNYQSYYYQFDPVHPKNIYLKKKLRKSIYSLNDIVNNNEYDFNEYSEFISSCFYPPQKIIPFWNNGTLVGGLVLYGSKGDQGFSSVDDIRLEMIAPFIAKTLSDHLLIENLSTNEERFETICTQSTTGLLIVDEYLKIQYYNPSAWKYCSEFCSKKNHLNPVKQFIKQLLLTEDMSWKFGLNKSILSNHMNKFTIKVIASLNHGKQIYTIYLSPNQSSDNKMVSLPDNITNRQREIIELILQGLTNQEIANKLFISVSTVKRHLDTIYTKFDVSNRIKLCNKLNNFNPVKNLDKLD